MKTVVAIAFAIMCLAAPVHSAESTVNVETITEAADDLARFDGRCATWRNQLVCAF